MQDKKTLSNSIITEFDVLQLIKVLWQKAWLIVIVTVIFAVSAFGYTKFFVTPLYSASVKFYVNNSAISLDKASVSLSSSDLTASKTLVDTYIVILKTRSTLNSVIEDADLSYTYEQLVSMISASSVNSTEVFSVTVTGNNAAEATLIANTIADIFPDRISDIVANSSARVVDYAVVNKHPVSPSYSKNVAIGLVLGVILSVAAIFLAYYLDDKIHEEDYLSHNYPYAVLAVIPNLNSRSTGKYLSKGKRNNAYYSSAHLKVVDKSGDEEEIR